MKHVSPAATPPTHPHDHHKACCAKCTRMPYNPICGRPDCGCHKPKENR